MFLDSGDGIILLGDSGPWYSPYNKQFELSKDAAYNLLGKVGGAIELTGRLKRGLMQRLLTGRKRVRGD